MDAQRSASQILHGFLPDQTVDLHGGIYRVKHWRTAQFLNVDMDALTSQLLRLVRPWESAENDNGFARRLRKGHNLRVHTLDLHNGVAVERYPRVWQCRACNRVVKTAGAACRCGANSWGQLQFVGYHSCGNLEEPWIPRCKTHDDVMMVFPGSADASQIKFQCPTCQTVLRKGFGFKNCDCGTGRVSYNVHRAASVFTPRSFAVVNAMSKEKIEILRAEGGKQRALDWVIAGMDEAGLSRGVEDRQAFIDHLVSMGVSLEIAESAADEAHKSGSVTTTSIVDDLGAKAPVALEEAVTIFSAMSDSRLTLTNLVERTTETSPLGRRYRERYPLRVARAGLEGIELLDRFPVLTGHFGYTRGDSTPGESKLRTWRDPKKGQHVVYADLQETEALFVRLDPERVLAWLKQRGHSLPEASRPEVARRLLLERVAVPQPGEEPDAQSIGSDVLTLVHSFSHRLIRQVAVMAGLDRNSLAELLVPSHLGFFAYASARGDFVLGGLQAVFETELDRLMEAVVGAESRCAMDPGCGKQGAACMACLHLGEPSCRYFNRFLDRRVLFGDQGYLRR